MEYITITRDTCCLNTKSAIGAMNELECLEQRDLIDIDATEVMDRELPKGPNIFRDKACSHIFFTSYYTLQRKSEFEEIKNIVFPDKLKLTRNDYFDIWNLLIHKQYSRDYFVTLDKHILKKKDRLKTINIIVLTPEGCLKEMGVQLKKQKLLYNRASYEG